MKIVTRSILAFLAPAFLALAFFTMVAPAARAEVFMLRGKVVMADGAAAPAGVAIERVCGHAAPVKQAATDRKGQFLLPVADKDIMGDIATSSGVLETQTGETSVMAINSPLDAQCRIRATLAGYESNSFNLREVGWTNSPDLPALTLYAKGSADLIDLAETKVPADAETAWNRAMKAIQAKNWADAERELRAAVARAPKFAQGWNTMALVCQKQKNAACERDAYTHAIAAQPKSAEAYQSLMRLEMSEKQWDAAEKAAAGFLQANKAARADAYADHAVILFYLKNTDGALTAANEALRLDPNHQWPRIEYIAGSLLEAKADYAGARDHLKKYLELEPNAPDAGEVRLQIDNLGKGGGPAMVFDSAVRELPSNGEAWVPGGLKAFAAMAHLEREPTYRDFYELYCRAITRETSIWNILPRPHFTETLQAYMSAVNDLAALGARHEGGSTVTMSFATDAARRKTEQVLALLGWRVVAGETGGSVGQTVGQTVEPGDRPADALHQQIPSAFGIDEVAMQAALEGGREYRFEVPSEKAMLFGGAAWTAAIKDARPYAGGIADVFSRDWRMAKAYAGLSAINPEAAAAVVKGVGLQNLAVLYADELAEDGRSFRVAGGIAVTPGGVAAEPAWTKLAGANPHDPAAFFRAILEKDHGVLAAFYAALSGESASDSARQRFFLASAARAERWYAWYRASGEIHAGLDRRVGTWHAALLRNLPVDEAGNIRYPGGRAAWLSRSESDDELTTMKTLEALVPVAAIEEKRKQPLDPEAARLLAQNYSEWQSLFPYFEELPGLTGASFQALAAFSARVSGLRAAQRNAIMSEWQPAVELIVLGTKSGALNAAKGARFFDKACAELIAANSGAPALALLREMAGGDASADSVARNLLRLTPARRAAFDRVRELQGAQPPNGLASFVYGALLSPDTLLVAEDPRLLRKHQFVDQSGLTAVHLFPPSELVASSETGSYFKGGFAQMADVVKNLARAGGKPAEAPVDAAVNVASTSGALESGPSATDTVFRTNARLVEVPATVTDSRGRYVDDLSAAQFTVLENGKAVPAAAFEGRASSVSVALLFDTTGSMYASLPALRSAALKLIGELRPIDSVAVYSFAEAVDELQPFTRDREAAKRAVLRTSAGGATALYDALVRVNRDLAGRSGKKVIVVFTDGGDNLSVLTNRIAIDRAQNAGIPIYTIAQGDALKAPQLLKQLATVSKTTGGESFTIQSPNDIRKVFESVTQDLMHGYLLAFQPPAVEGHVWRTIEVTLKGANGRSVRARDGYYPE